MLGFWVLTAFHISRCSFVSALGDLDCVLTSLILKAYLTFANEKGLAHIVWYSSNQIQQYSTKSTGFLKAPVKSTNLEFITVVLSWVKWGIFNLLGYSIVSCVYYIPCCYYRYLLRCPYGKIPWVVNFWKT